jgi:hypothetical protein
MPRTTQRDFNITLRNPHDKQREFIDCEAKRIMVRAGRRGGKTYGIAIRMVQRFLSGRRQLYAAPTVEQVETFWYEVCRALSEPIQAGILKKNETEHVIEFPNTKLRIKAKTAWNANTLRGDYADDLTLDEFQLMNEDAWFVIGVPMLLDNNGDAVFIYTPPSLHSQGVSKAKDPMHAAKMFKEKQGDKNWATFHFTSFDNPHISVEALDSISRDMSRVAYRLEILAEDIDEAWKGLIYSSFNQGCIKPRVPIPKEWLVYVGHDFGGANPAAMFYAQDPSTGYFYAFHEYLPGSGLSPAKHVDNWKIITEGYKVIKCTGGSHQEEEVRAAYIAHGWYIFEPKTTKVKPGIDKVYALHELNKIIVFEDLYNYLFEKANYSWKLDDRNMPTGDIEDKSRYHLMDAERYILSDFTPETVPSVGIRRTRIGDRHG